MSQGPPPKAPSTPLALERVIEVYEKDVDRSPRRENLEPTPDERLRKQAALVKSLRRCGRGPTPVAAEFGGLLRAPATPGVELIVVGGVELGCRTSRP